MYTRLVWVSKHQTGTENLIYSHVNLVATYSVNLCVSLRGRIPYTSDFNNKFLYACLLAVFLHVTAGGNYDRTLKSKAKNRLNNI